MRGFGSSVSCQQEISGGLTSLQGWTRAHLDKGVDGKDNELRLGFGVVHEVEVDELLLFQTGSARRAVSCCLNQVEARKGGGLLFGLHVLEDIGEESCKAGEARANASVDSARR